MPVIPGIAVSSGMVVLGTGLSNDISFVLGRPGCRWVDGEQQPPTPDPVLQRAQDATQLAEAIKRMATDGSDEYVHHVAFVMLQRLICPALDFDARACGNMHVRDLQSQVATRVTRALEAILGMVLPVVALQQAGLPAELGGLALRLPTDKGRRQLQDGRR